MPGPLLPLLLHLPSYDLLRLILSDLHITSFSFTAFAFSLRDTLLHAFNMFSIGVSPRHNVLYPFPLTPGSSCFS